ncbi:MAG: MerR family transcriptional regulator [Chloroflexi bacterium]|nr:MerR family transcriptional regulator [Chloroflexota bacterium]
MTMLKVGEFSQLARVSVRTLHYYDEINLFKPRHIDRESDYRFYDLEQLPALNRIIALKELGFSLKQIQGLLGDALSPDDLREMLSHKQAELKRQLEQRALQLAHVETRIRQIELEGQVSPYEVLLKSAPKKTVLSKRIVVPSIADMPELRCPTYQAVYDHLADCDVNPQAPEFVIYHNLEYCEIDIDMEMVVEIDPADAIRLNPTEELEIATLPAAETVASVIHHGRHWDVGLALTALYRWIVTSPYQADGPYSEIHLYGRELDQTDETMSGASLVMEFQVPLRRAP